MREADNSLLWKATGESSYAPDGWVAGTDTIGFFHGTFGFLGVTNLLSLSHPKVGLAVNLKDKAPERGTQIADLTRVSARFVIRNNKFLFNRKRGPTTAAPHFSGMSQLRNNGPTVSSNVRSGILRVSPVRRRFWVAAVAGLSALAFSVMCGATATAEDALQTHPALIRYRSIQHEHAVDTRPATGT
jgi:hypothetical protein